MRYWENDYNGWADNFVGRRRGLGGGGSWLQQMDKHCRVVADVPHLQVRPVFSRHSDTQWAVEGLAQTPEQIYCRDL